MVRQPAEVEALARKVVALVEERFPVRMAWLFGSYASGHPTDESDIAVFADGVADMGIDEKMEFLAEIQRRSAPEVELHLFPSEALKESCPSNFYGYIAAHGKSLAA
jgi:predicted nucleotidyltransferase